MLSFIWENGGDIATQEGDEWVGQLDSPESIAGLEYFKQVFDEANAAPADGDDANDYLAFCAGEVGMMPAPGWKPGQIINPDDGCPDMEANIGVFAMPGTDGRHDGAGVPRRLEPRHPDQQREPGPGLRPAEDHGRRAGYQQQLAEAGLIPALKSELGDVSRQRRRRGPGRRPPRTAGSCRPARTGPASRRPTCCPTCSSQIAQGGDIADAAAAGRRGDRSRAQRLTPTVGRSADGRRRP